MPDTNSETYIAATKIKAVFASDGPKPQFLFDTPGFKTLVVGLEPGQQIPLHPGEATMYHFLDGTGLMTVGEHTYEVKPGVTIIVPSGMTRGMNARTQIVFLGAKGS